MADYISDYTGENIDSSVSATTITMTQEQLNGSSPSSYGTNKLIIVTNGSNANTLWRSNNTSFVQVGGSPSEGTIVSAITDLAELSNEARLAGITIGGTTYRVTHAVLSQTSSSGDDIFYQLVIN